MAKEVKETKETKVFTSQEIATGLMCALAVIRNEAGGYTDVEIKQAIEILEYLLRLTKF